MASASPRKFGNSVENFIEEVKKKDLESIEGIMDSVCGYLDEANKKSDRPVSKVWNEEKAQYTEELYTKHLDFIFAGGKSGKPLPNIRRFITAYPKTASFAFSSKVKITKDLVTQLKDTKMLTRFFQSISPIVTQLSISDFPAGRFLPEDHDFPQLKELEVAYDIEGVEHLIYNSPKLFKVTVLPGISESTAGLGPLLEIIQFQYINNLIIKPVIEQSHLAQLSKLDMKLVSCEINFNAGQTGKYDGLTAFLESQSGQLKRLAVQVPGDSSSSSDLQLPRMTCLESISMCDNFAEDIFVNLEDRLPVLKRIIFWGVGWKWFSQLSCHPIMTVEELQIRYSIEETGVKYGLQNLAWAFPNIKILNVYVGPGGVGIVNEISESFPNIRELKLSPELDIEGDPNPFDHIITGLTFKERKDIQFPVDLDFVTLEELLASRGLEPQYKPISCLTNLKVLKVNVMDSDMTDFSCRLVLKKMDWLSRLDIVVFGGRIKYKRQTFEMIWFLIQKISESIVAEMRKKFKVRLQHE